ncbi:hypothetical protein [Caballeronia sp. LZ043]|uniref:hypothetical protein n=1 Tax=Caballeronia sp. LZ043 TaxID=3038569 RepID=UPI00286CAFBD|nr:hypothetical protein [Caballeronia sp. LZ043]
MFDAGMANKENLAVSAFEEHTALIGIRPDGMDKHWLNVAPPRHVAFTSRFACCQKPHDPRKTFARTVKSRPMAQLPPMIALHRAAERWRLERLTFPDGTIPAASLPSSASSGICRMFARTNPRVARTAHSKPMTIAALDARNAAVLIEPGPAATFVRSLAQPCVNTRRSR